MVQTIVKPLKKDFDMSVSLPSEYVGKEVHVLFYIEEEVENSQAKIISNKKPSDYFGTLSQEDAKKMQEYVIQNREEWQ